MTPIKKIALRAIVIVVMLLILWDQVGSVFVQITCSIHHARMRSESLARSAADTIFTNGANDPKLELVERDEVKYCGRMFDVKKTIQLNNCRLLIGHYDRDEDQLYELLKAFLSLEQEDVDLNQEKISFFCLEALLPAVYQCGKFTGNLRQITLGEYCATRYAICVSRSLFQPPELAGVQ